MPYTLDDMAAECRTALQNNPAPAGLEALRLCVEKACKDAEFIATHLGPDNTEDRKVLYEDPDLKFCILAHVNLGAKGSPPHDHGPSWAIYGQAVGETEMTDWRCVQKPTPDSPGMVRKVKTYTLTPGMAYAYQVGDLHSPYRAGETRLIRMEGMNMAGVKRDAYMVAPD